MLPLSLLKTAQRHGVVRYVKRWTRFKPGGQLISNSLPDRHGFFVQLVELKNGETYNGYLQHCDTWMNLHLSEVICTSKVGGVCVVVPWS